MCTGASFLSLTQCDAKISDLELELLDNSLDLRLQNKYASNEIEEINFTYQNERDLVKSELDNVDRNSSEYEDILLELKEMADEKDAKVEKVTKESSDYENEISTENATLETQLQDLRANKESYEKMIEDDSESFNYFSR